MSKKEIKTKVEDMAEAEDPLSCLSLLSFQRVPGLLVSSSFSVLFFLFFKFYFIFKLYITVLVLPNIKMNPPQLILIILRILQPLYYFSSFFFFFSRS